MKIISFKGYTLSRWAEKIEGGYVPHWACQCEEIGANNTRDKTEEKCLLAAQLFAHNHVLSKHKK